MFETIKQTTRTALVIFTLCLTACSQTKSSAQKKQNESDAKNANAQSIDIENNSPNQTGKEIWSGESAGFRIRWTTDNLTAGSTAGGGNAFAVQDFAAKGFDQYYKSVFEREDLDKDLKGKIDFYNRHFRLLSVVGSLISFEDDLDASSKILKIPSNENFAYRDVIESRFLTVDLTKPENLSYITFESEITSEINPNQPGRAVLLTDLFSEQDILRALLADPIIKRALSKVKKNKPPVNLTELISQLDEQDLIAPNCIFYLPEDYLTRFAFHHIENNEVAVRLSLQPTIQSCRGQKAQLGLLLPIPVSLKKSLALADSNKEGFLMKQQAVKFTPKQETYVGFDEESISKKK